jgi:2-methylaconitate cis-trans-isomerase PrpF
VRVSLGHVTNPVVFVAAEDLGVDIAATPAVLEGDHVLLDRLERLRRIAGVRMGLADDPAGVPLGNPKIACVGPATLMRDLSGQTVPAEAMDVAIRAVSMGGLHRAVPVTMALCAAALATMPGTLLATLAAGRADGTRLRLGTPSGVVTTEADVVWEGTVPAVRRVSILRTARLLMSGLVNSANINDYPESHSFAAR